MDKPAQLVQFWNVVRAFFPLQLLLSHFKYNIFSLILWAVLFLIVNDTVGYSFGIPLLFLSPEYLGTVSPWSFFLLGFATGGFITGFNTYSYLKLGPHFPFLVTLDKPFYKFCLNNSIIPLLFMFFFMYRIFEFQLYEELTPVSRILFYLLTFLIGSIGFTLISFAFFFRVNRRQMSYSTRSSQPIQSVIVKQESWYETFKNKKEKSSIYIGRYLRLNISRSAKHLDEKVIRRIHNRYKINTSLFELLTICMFLVLGAFNEFNVFEVPAAVSIVLLLTIFLMLFSALHSWLKGWVYLISIATLVLMNFLSIKTGLFNYTNYVYGLDYKTNATDEYSIDRIKDLNSSDSLYLASRNSYLKTLENWKSQTLQTKPKLVIINTSGGGSRSTLWTTIVLQETDKALNGGLMQHTQLITGASGGMIGAAYFRELHLRKQLGEIKDIYLDEYRQNISKDMLNKLSFMASTNDLFIRYQQFDFNQQLYTKDRGYAFEEQLHKNTNNILKHTLGYYTEHEQSGTIPTMVLSPTIINDGRRLLIASQSMQFLAHNSSTPLTIQGNEDLDIHGLLSHQETGNIRFSSALRTSATFPFVMPMVTLPTTPETQLMDAGIRDNYGTKTMMSFLFEMRDWIKENTSGVIVLQIRDTKKVLDNESYQQISFIDKITLPFGNMYKNFPRVQDFNNEDILTFGASNLDFPINLVTFNLREKKEDRISLSWHLTKMEKQKIEDAFQSKRNQQALNQLKELLQKKRN